MLRYEDIKKARTSPLWDKGNQVLYDLCKKYPNHTSDDEILAKIWLIGRSYSAAIERRRKSKIKVNDFSYEKDVLPAIKKSKIDEWLRSIQRYETIDHNNFWEILSIHKNVMDLFNTISGLNKRSLASKYLHFHCPSLFFIYDSNACSEIKRLKEIIAGFSSNIIIKVDADKDYRKFAEQCLALRDFIYVSYKVLLTTRQIDNLLLHAEKKP